MRVLELRYFDFKNRKWFFRKNGTYDFPALGRRYLCSKYVYIFPNFNHSCVYNFRPHAETAAGRNRNVKAHLWKTYIHTLWGEIKKKRMIAVKWHYRLKFRKKKKFRFVIYVTLLYFLFLFTCIFFFFPSFPWDLLMEAHAPPNVGIFSFSFPH